MTRLVRDFSLSVVISLMALETDRARANKRKYNNYTNDVTIIADSDDNLQRILHVLIIHRKKIKIQHCI